MRKLFVFVQNAHVTRHCIRRQTVLEMLEKLFIIDDRIVVMIDKGGVG